MEGTLAWSFATGGAIEASPALGADGTVYVGSADGYFYAVNPDGSLKWSHNTGGEIVGSASVGADGTVYVGSTDGYFYAFASDGTVQWVFATGYSIEGTPAIAPDGTIYIANSSNRLFALNPDGTEKWRLNAGDAIVGAPAVDIDGTIYISAGWRGVIALHPDGSEKWLFRLDAMDFVTAPIIADSGYIYIGNADGKLYAIGAAAPRILSAGPESGYEGEQQQFTMEVDGSPPLQYYWDFGGAVLPNTSNQASPLVTLGEPGTYDVTISVGNLFGEAVYVFEFTVKSFMRGDWWMYGREPKHQRRSPHAGPDSPSIKWEHFASSSLRSSPSLAADGTVYICNITGVVRAIRPDGYRKWMLDLGSAIYSTPALAKDGTLYVGTLGKRLVAIDYDGNTKWIFTAGDSIRSSPAIARDGNIYVGCGDGNLYAVSPDGEELWSFHTELPITSSPAIGDDGTIYVGSWDGNVYAINPDGSEQWMFVPSGEGVPCIQSSPTLGNDGVIYIPITFTIPQAVTNLLFAINPDGSEKWTLSVGPSTLSPVAIGADGTVYVGDTSLYAISPDGDVMWTFEIPHEEGQTLYGTQAAPVVDGNGVIYLPSYYSYYDPVTFKWTFEGLLFAVNPDGTEKWHLTTRAGGTAVNSSSPAIGDDGTIYLPSEDSFLYAIGEADWVGF